MILKSLELTSIEPNKRPSILVPVPQFGENAQIMVTEMTIDGYVRKGNLMRKIMADKEMTEVRRASMMMCAQVLSVMVDPDTGDFLLKETDLEAFHAQVKKDTLEALLLADAKLNPINVEQLTIQEKKSSS